MCADPIHYSLCSELSFQILHVWYCCLQVFDKALFEPHFCELYSELCYVLQKKLPEFDDPGAELGLIMP